MTMLGLHEQVAVALRRAVAAAGNRDDCDLVLGVIQFAVEYHADAPIATLLDYAHANSPPELENEAVETSDGQLLLALSAVRDILCDEGLCYPLAGARALCSYIYALIACGCRPVVAGMYRPIMAGAKSAMKQSVFFPRTEDGPFNDAS